MNSAVQQIYDAVAEDLRRRADIDLLSTRYFPEIFGNFIISFRFDGREASLVNERFELFLCDQLGGQGDRHIVVPDIREQTLAEVLAEIERVL